MVAVSSVGQAYKRASLVEEDGELEAVVCTGEKKNQYFGNCCFSVKDTEKFTKLHFFIYKRSTTNQKFKVMAQELRLPRP